jgi:hypothetical protein
MVESRGRSLDGGPGAAGEVKTFILRVIYDGIAHDDPEKYFRVLPSFNGRYTHDK